MTPEARVRNPVVAYAKTLGIGHIRMHMGFGSKSGWPDDTFLIPGGRPFFVEFKAPGKEPRPLQYHRMQELRDLGYDVAWFDNADEACAALKQRARLDHALPRG